MRSSRLDTISSSTFLAVLCAEPEGHMNVIQLQSLLYCSQNSHLPARLQVFLFRSK